jgi:hypothetical protein
MTISIKTLRAKWILADGNHQWTNKTTFYTIILKFSNYLIPLKAVQNDEISPFAAAQLLLQKYFK